MPDPDLEIIDRTRFAELIRRWSADTEYVSSTTQIADHPACREIISDGRDRRASRPRRTRKPSVDPLARRAQGDHRDQSVPCRGSRRCPSDGRSVVGLGSRAWISVVNSPRRKLSRHWFREIIGSPANARAFTIASPGRPETKRDGGGQMTRRNSESLTGPKAHRGTKVLTPLPPRSLPSATCVAGMPAMKLGLRRSRSTRGMGSPPTRPGNSPMVPGRASSARDLTSATSWKPSKGPHMAPRLFSWLERLSGDSVWATFGTRLARSEGGVYNE
jgi:hypothetical protein